jgi:DNA invertase Pin-like site-specific DNA recombinase
VRWLRADFGTFDITVALSHTDRVPRTAILYARSNRRENLDRQVRELEDWCDRAGVVPISTVVEVAIGVRASRRCRQVLTDVAAGLADLVLIRDVSRLSEDAAQLEQIISEHRSRLAISRDDRHH